MAMETRKAGWTACALLGALLGGSATAAASPLGDAAAAMAPGTFAELAPMDGWEDGAILSPADLGCTAGDYITQYADKAAWDPVHLRLNFIGQAHGNCYGGRFVRYEDAANAWSVGPYPPGICQSGTADDPCFSHGYAHSTVDPENGDYYYRQSFGLDFFRYRDGDWSTLPSPPTQSSNCCGALEYFPDTGQLLFLDGDWGLWALDPATSQWTQLANTSVADAAPGLPNLPMTSTGNWALYNPVHAVVLFGGGDVLYKLDASGAITTQNAPPMSLAVTQTVLSVDPVSGAHIVLAESGMYQYDVTADSWLTLPTAVPQVLTALLGVGDGLIQAPISTYGVILYVKYAFDDSSVYLYKHAVATCTSDADCVAPGPCFGASCDSGSGTCMVAAKADGEPCPGGTCEGGVCSGEGTATSSGAGGGPAVSGAGTGSGADGSGVGSGPGAGGALPSGLDDDAGTAGGCACHAGMGETPHHRASALLLAVALAAQRRRATVRLRRGR
jgi:hypothetical protein